MRLPISSAVFCCVLEYFLFCFFDAFFCCFCLLNVCADKNTRTTSTLPPIFAAPQLTFCCIYRSITPPPPPPVTLRPRSPKCKTQRMADGSFSSRTLCNVCFSPIVMPSKDGSGGAPESQAVRSVKRPHPPPLLLLSRSVLHSQRARRYSPPPCQKGYPVVGAFVCVFFFLSTRGGK